MYLQVTVHVSYYIDSKNISPKRIIINPQFSYHKSAAWLYGSHYIVFPKFETAEYFLEKKYYAGVLVSYLRIKSIQRDHLVFQVGTMFLSKWLLITEHDLGTMNVCECPFIAGESCIVTEYNSMSSVTCIVWHA